MAMKSLRDRAKEMTATLPFMEGKEKADIKDILGDVVTINEYGFMDGKDGPYVVVTFDEYPKSFFFGGSVLTSKMTEFEEDGYHETINKEGLPVRFEITKSKNNRDYTDVILFPEIAE